MTDSLKERLAKAIELYPGMIDAKLAKEALDRIEELEATDWHEVYRKTAEKNKRLVAERDEAHEAVIQHCALIERQAAELTDTKALLAGQSARMIDLELAVSRQAAEIERLKQESNYWQMAAMHANEREEESQAEIERLREALECAIAANELVLSQLKGGSDLTADQVVKSLNASMDKARAMISAADGE